MLAKIITHAVDRLLCGIPVEAVAGAGNDLQLCGRVDLQRPLRIGERSNAVLVAMNQQNILGIILNVVL